MKSKIIFSAFVMSLLSGCGMIGVHHSEVKPPPAPAAAQAAKETPQAEAPPAAKEEDTQKTEAATAEAKPEAKTETKPEAKAEPAAPEVKSAEAATAPVPAETSLGWLKHGNTRFVKKRFRSDGRSAKDRERLTNGEHPHAIILSCSDSRVPPEIIFDQALGEIYVVRVAGEALDSSVLASLEYAVEHLHSSLLIVMGHSQCGAIEAAVKTAEGNSPDFEKLVNDIRPRLSTVKNETPSKNLEVESTLNADGVARDLVKRSSILKNAVEQGHLVIKPALYRTDTGKVTFY